MSGYSTLIHGRTYRPSVSAVMTVGRASQMVLVAGARLLRVDAGAAERRAEVDQVVPDDAAPVSVDERVERVDAARVVVVEPRREHAQAAQLAAVLVRVDVVRIVGPRAVVAERPDRPAGAAPCSRSRGTCRRRCGRAASSSAIDVVLGERALLARRCRGSSPGSPITSLSRRSIGEVVLGHVVAERVEELGGRPSRRRSPSPGFDWRIELDEPDDRRRCRGW